MKVRQITVNNNPTFGKLETPIATNSFMPKFIKIVKENKGIHLLEPTKPSKFKLWLTKLYVSFGEKIGFLPKSRLKTFKYTK